MDRNNIYIKKLAVGFDLGRTLLGDENIPLSWKSLYKEALIDALHRCNSNIDDNKISIGEEILLKYNTRTNYREIEISSDVIFSEILVKWQMNKEENLAIVKEAFFSYFQRNVKLYEDTTSTLKILKERGIKIGILTDVPYGMDKKLVLADIEKFKEYIDIVLTSVEVGYRKPNRQGFIQLSKELAVDLNEVNEIEEEMDMWTKEFLKYFSVKKVNCYEDAVKFISEQ
ncbi:MAG: HAD hydrolase-like protein [Bacillota bacterium]|nr:HAD hydrolase-like protein [Bacillota bacterium]